MFSVLRGTVYRFFTNDGLFLAAGFAFFFLICLIPLTLLGVSAAGFVLSTEEAGAQVVAQLTRNFPVYEREINRVLLRIVQTRKLSGLVGTGILVLFSTSLIGAARLVMHRMLGIRGSHNVVGHLVADVGRVLLLSGLLFGATVATWSAQWVQAFVLEPAQLPLQWIHMVSITLSVGFSALMFYLGYRYVPVRHVRVGAAISGAILASLLWEVAKQLFRLYVQEVGLVGQIYGPLGVLVAVVMFVYYSAVVFVFGAAYVAALDGRRR